MSEGLKAFIAGCVIFVVAPFIFVASLGLGIVFVMWVFRLVSGA